MPVLHLLVGPNGAGKTTLFERVIGPATQLPFVNADHIARRRWPGKEQEQAYAAGRVAAKARSAAIAKRRSLAAETVFSHPSKVELVRQALDAGYLVAMHVVMIPEPLAVSRALLRHQQGGHAVPEDKVRSRYRRLWDQVRAAIPLVQECIVYDNSSARRPFRPVALFLDGQPAGEQDWPDWSPLP